MRWGLGGGRGVTGAVRGGGHGAHAASKAPPAVLPHSTAGGSGRNQGCSPSQLRAAAQHDLPKPCPARRRAAWHSLAGRPTCSIGRGMAWKGPATSLHTTTSASALICPCPALPPPPSGGSSADAAAARLLPPVRPPLPGRGCHDTAVRKCSAKRLSSPRRCSRSLPRSLRHGTRGAGPPQLRPAQAAHAACHSAVDGPTTNRESPSPRH